MAQLYRTRSTRRRSGCFHLRHRRWHRRPLPRPSSAVADWWAIRSVLTAYAWYDRRLYFEAGGYETYGPSLLSWTGNALGPGSTANIAPYVRAAYQWDWNGQSAHIGALLLSANINPAISAFSADGSHGRNQYTDYGLDAGYQFLGDPNIASAYVLYVHENQNLKGSFNTGASSQPSNGLNQLNMNATYYYQNTYGATLGWQYTWGTANPSAIPAGTRHWQPQRQAKQQRLHRRGRLDTLR